MKRIECSQNEKMNIFNDINKIFFVTQGEMKVSFGKYINVKVTENQFFLVLAKCQCNIVATENTEIILFPLNINLNFCDHFSFEMLLELNKGKMANTTKLTVLEVNPRLKNCLESAKNYLKDGITCSYFLNLKMRELLFLLRAYYTKESLFALFSPVLSTDIQFSNKIYENCEKIQSVPELAERMNYSTSGFEKRFKRVFGVPAYQWLKMKKAQNIYHEINCTKKTFSEIGYEYGFSSSAYFNDFCKANFGYTPGEIRKMKQKMQQI